MRIESAENSTSPSARTGDKQMDSRIHGQKRKKIVNEHNPPNQARVCLPADDAPGRSPAEAAAVATGDGGRRGERRECGWRDEWI